MNLSDFLFAELEREAVSTRRLLLEVPAGKTEFKPAEKSMAFGYLAALVASMPGWVDFMVNRDELDLASAEGARNRPVITESADELVRILDAAMEKARASLPGKSDEFLHQPWRFVVAGKVASETPRYIAISDSLINHWVHHRGQLSVYLRLLNAKVPSVYGPSADEPFQP